MNTTKLSAVLPKEVYDLIILENGIVQSKGINTLLRLSHFLAQTSHESNGFKTTEENLNYTAEGLLKIFPKYFPTLDYAKGFARKPEQIANKVYANRYGNGDEASGDGWKYRGRGYIQCTFKSNYQAFTNHVKSFKGLALYFNFVQHPDLIKLPSLAMLNAVWFWNSRNLSKLADMGANDDVVMQITKRINGGYTNLLDRQKKFNEFYALLT